MAMLQDVCDLPIEYDDFENRFRMGPQVKCNTMRRIPLASLAPTLLNESISYPEKVYEEYSVHMEGDSDIFSENIKYDLMVFPAGLLGIEYIKSHVFYSPTSRGSRLRFSTVVEGIQGITTIMMQKNTTPGVCFPDKSIVKEGLIVELKPKDKVGIPEGYMYSFMNTDEEPSIISRVYKTYSLLDYSNLKTKGLAYFCIRKNAKKEWVYNPRFRSIPSIKISLPKNNHLPNLGLDLSESLYNLVKARTEMFMEILSE